jgi:ABC-type transporter Mla subunit MlaD
MPETDRLSRIEQRQEALISAVAGLTEVMETTRAMVAELAAWLQRPPSNDLPDLLDALTAAVQGQGELIVALGQRVDALPARLAQAVREPR